MNTSKIKSSVFGLAFFGSMVFGGINSHAQESVEPGEGGEKWICCQVQTIETCTDILGGVHFGTVKNLSVNSLAPENRELFSFFHEILYLPFPSLYSDDFLFFSIF